MEEKKHSEKQKETLGSQISSSHMYLPQQKTEIPTPAEAAGQAEKLKKELDDFKKKVVKKFPFTLSLSVLPSHSFKYFEEDEGMLPEEIAKKPLHLLLLIPEDNYKDIQKKIKPEIVRLSHEGKHNIWVHIKTPVDVWNYGMDSKFEFIDAVGSSYPLYDKGFLGAIRVANIHKSLVLRKFEKYVATYAVGGSLVRGTADKDSDVDTFVIIDDTDVKKMPRVQLLEKLRGFIYEYIREATALAGVKNILNVQVYLLTDFWQSVKDATPVMFTFIRDGVPMYDRGTFLPWKLLLKMGKIKPSPEAVDTFMKYGEQNDALVKRRFIDAMIDIYWGVITPTQALMMLTGHAPPVPKTMAEEVKKELVEKEKVMTLNELRILEKTLKLYKDYEHGKLKEISGQEIDTLLREANEYDKKLKEIRRKLEEKLIEHAADAVHDEVFGLLKNIFGNNNKEALMSKFEKELVKEGKMPAKFIPIIKEVANIKTKSRSKTFSQSEMDRVRRDASDVTTSLMEYTQRKELVNVEKGVIPLSYGEGKAGELILTNDGVFFVEAGIIKKIEHGKFVESDIKALESALSKIKDKGKLKLSSDVLSVLKKELGEFEIIL